MMSAGISIFQENVVLPMVFGFVFALMALVLLTITSWKYGVVRSHITQHGSVEALREVFSSTTDKVEIQRVLTNKDSFAASTPARSLQREQSVRGGPGPMMEYGSDDNDHVSWSRFELGCFHDMGHADLGHLRPQFAG